MHTAQFSGHSEDLHPISPLAFLLIASVHSPEAITSSNHLSSYEEQFCKSNVAVGLIEGCEVGSKLSSADGSELPNEDGDGDGTTEGTSVSLHDLTASKQNVHIVHPSGHVLSHVISPVGNNFAAEVHFPSTISSNLHADEYESQSAISKLVTGFELGRSDGEEDGDDIGDNEVGD